MAAGRPSSAPRPFCRVLALTGTPTSASRWLSSRSWTARRGALGSADGRNREALPERGEAMVVRTEAHASLGTVGA
jgi:hypothetical protein